MRFADLDAVTIDAHGTLLELVEPVLRLAEALRSHGVDLGTEQVAAAFREEVEYYGAHAETARDGATLQALREECAGVFLRAARVELDPTAFCSSYVDALAFEPVPGAVETVRMLVARGIALAVVANWDPSLRDHLQSTDLARYFASVVVSAEVGARKPDPRPFRVALAELGVSSDRALHVGDSEIDEIGAAAAGLRFARAPLADAFAGWS
jgi:putative hydrolase of the HAD superfamily